METYPIFVRAGPQRVSAAFIRQFEGPMEDLMSPHDWSLVDRQIGVSGYGITALAHLKDLVVNGPHNPIGVSETPSRRRIFTCRPTSPVEELPCAEEIISRLGTRAFRRPLTDNDLDALMSFYEAGAGPVQRIQPFPETVALLEHLGVPEWESDAGTDAELLTEVYGRSCYRSFGTGLNPNLTRVRKTNRSYLANTLAKGDGSIFEHATERVLREVDRADENDAHHTVSGTSWKCLSRSSWPSSALLSTSTMRSAARPSP